VRIASGHVVAGATFVLLGALLLLDAAGAFELAAGVIPALLLLGLGLALIARRA
jgi:hypothetical protein